MFPPSFAGKKLACPSPSRSIQYKDPEQSSHQTGFHTKKLVTLNHRSLPQLLFELVYLVGHCKRRSGTKALFLAISLPCLCIFLLFWLYDLHDFKKRCCIHCFLQNRKQKQVPWLDFGLLVPKIPWNPSRLSELYVV